jgi:redox-sensitive bicupin YhaK (pirin superfamily)
VRREPGVLVRVLAGASADAVAPTLAYAPFTALDIRIEAGATFTQELPAGYNGFIVGLEGHGAVGSSATSIREGQVAWLTRSSAASMVALLGEASGMRAMLFAGGRCVSLWRRVAHSS